VSGACRRKRHQNRINGLNFVRNGENRKTKKKLCCRDFGFTCFLCFFTHFYFELAFGVNMKVLDNFVSFPMALVSRDFLILSYDENTTSRS